MDPQVRDLITIALASWGAFTGTLALLLRFLRHAKDRSSLRATAHFRYHIGYEMPPSISLIVSVANTGHRPATIAALVGQWNARWPWGTTFWRLRGRGRVDLNRRDLGQELTEGRSTTIEIQEKDLPTDLGLLRIRKYLLKDQTGRLWPVRLKGRRELAEILSSEEIARGQVESAPKASLRWIIHKIGSRFWAVAELKKGNATYNRAYVHKTEKRARVYCERISEKMKDFLEGKIQDHEEVLRDFQKGDR